MISLFQKGQPPRLSQKVIAKQFFKKFATKLSIIPEAGEKEAKYDNEVGNQQIPLQNAGNDDSFSFEVSKAEDFGPGASILADMLDIHHIGLIRLSELSDLLMLIPANLKKDFGYFLLDYKKKKKKLHITKADLIELLNNAAMNKERNIDLLILHVALNNDHRVPVIDIKLPIKNKCKANNNKQVKQVETKYINSCSQCVQNAVSRNVMKKKCSTQIDVIYLL